MRVNHMKPNPWRRWGENVAALLLLVLACYGAVLLALVTWAALVGSGPCGI